MFNKILVTLLICTSLFVSIKVEGQMQKTKIEDKGSFEKKFKKFLLDLENKEKISFGVIVPKKPQKDILKIVFNFYYVERKNIPKITIFLLNDLFKKDLNKEQKVSIILTFYKERFDNIKESIPGKLMKKIEVLF